MPKNEFISKFPGVSRVSESDGALVSLYFLEYQTERQIIECMMDTLRQLLKPEPCHCVVVKTGEEWYDVHRYYKVDEIVSSLFDCSMSKYIIKIGIERHFDGRFNLWLKFRDVEPEHGSNIGPDFIDYVTSMMDV